MDDLFLSSSEISSFDDNYEYDTFEETYAGVTVSWLIGKIEEMSSAALAHSKTKQLAAVTIQATFRGWRIRKRIIRMGRAAIKIQKTWRGYLVRVHVFSVVEPILQRRIVDYYDKPATIIQTAFRGYYSRKYKHDQRRLKELQLKAASELLKCVAKKTRQAILHQQLPGLYTLRNSKCLEKVKILLEAIQLKFYNEKSRKAQKAENSKRNEAFKTCSMKNKELSEVSFENDDNCQFDNQTERDQGITQTVRLSFEVFAIQERELSLRLQKNLT